MYRSNVVGARQLLEAIAATAASVRAQSCSPVARMYTETLEKASSTRDLRPAPANDYGVTKVAMEYVASIYAARLPLIIARPFNYTGRGQSHDFIIPKIVAHIRDRASVIELGNLDVARDFSDVRTIVDAYVRLLEHQCRGGRNLQCLFRPSRLASGSAPARFRDSRDANSR